ncbi:propanediol utilization protein [Neotabrizicola shimadae]|uniref:Propanediol utilization protein n=1 Tax=Neotabrizicola shimadae TaxID=2807096 RepID=A0A8G1ECX7_9RHOB|nr:propanediol utilization protein [Neotabrizicola shimadae]
MTAGASVTADPLPPGARVALPCHFGEWLQGRIGPAGPVGLVTLLPAVTGLAGQRRAGALAACRFGQGAGLIPLPRLRRFLNDLGLPPKGRYLLKPRFVPGSGTGMSTASLLAVARLAGYAGPRGCLVRACLRAEGASDPLMLDHPDRHLWASRQGEVLMGLPPPPRAELLVGFWGPPERTRAEDCDYADISDLVSDWSNAPGLAGCAALASESARRCQARRGPASDPTADLARALGALGFARSHSGPARALIFAPGSVPPEGPQILRAAGYTGVERLATAT